MTVPIYLSSLATQVNVVKDVPHYETTQTWGWRSTDGVCYGTGFPTRDAAVAEEIRTLSTRLCFTSAGTPETIGGGTHPLSTVPTRPPHPVQTARPAAVWQSGEAPA